MAYVQRKPRSPYWMARYTDASGKRVVRSTKETKRKTAQAIADEWEAAVKKAVRAELTQAASVKILSNLMELSIGERLDIKSTRKFCEEWLQQRDENTRKRYKPVITAFLTSLGPIRAGASITSVTASEVERFRDAERAAGKGATTANFGLRTIRSVLAHARRMGLALSNPAEAVPLLSSEAEERDPFTDADITGLLKVAGKSDWRGMVFFGLHCGMRLHDAANLGWQNIDPDAGTVTFTQEKKRKRKAASVKITLHPELLDHLKGLPRGVGAAPIFPTLHGVSTGSAGGLSNAFRQLMEKAKVTMRLGEEKKGKGRRFRSKGFHSFRHTFISRLTNADVSADVRKKMAGHTDDQVHERYSHLAIETQRRAVEKLAWAEA